MLLKTWIPFAMVVIAWAPPAQEPVPGALPTPREIRERLEKELLPFAYRVEKDQVISSDTVPGLKLRRLEVKFYTSDLPGGKWGHPSVVFLPLRAMGRRKRDARGRVVIVGQRSWDGLATGPWRDSFLGNYGEPIASLTGYPVMICPVPGEYDGGGGREISIGFLRERRRRSRDPVDHSYVRLAAPYLRALDVMAGILEIPPGEIRAVIGGHSKRATSAYTAAAMDPDRIAGVVFMGNESTWEGYLRPGSPWKAVAPPNTQKWVRAKVLYIGGTNEDGYAMFNINKIVSGMKEPWTVAMVPNYRHASQSEKHFLDWRMWISHVFDGRPLTKISGLSWEKKEKGFLWGGRDRGAGTLFRAGIESKNKIIQVRVWYVYNDDGPYWRDLVWYPEFMVRGKDGLYEGYVTGKFPDAWMVEVKDTAMGFPGYVTSPPQNLSGTRPRTRRSFGSRPRTWSERL